MARGPKPISKRWWPNGSAKAAVRPAIKKGGRSLPFSCGRTRFLAASLAVVVHAGNARFQLRRLKLWHLQDAAAEMARPVAVEEIDHQADARPDRQYDHRFKGQIEEQE